MSVSSSWKPSFRPPRIFSERLIFAGARACIVPCNLFCHSERSRGISYRSTEKLSRCGGGPQSPRQSCGGENKRIFQKYFRAGGGAKRKSAAKPLKNSAQQICF